MKIELDILNPLEWATLSENSHLAVFNEIRKPEWDRLDFAILVLVDKELVGYATVREFDHETAYLQYGGAFPKFKKTFMVYQCYMKLIRTLCEKYPRLMTYVENENINYLKLAMKAGFRIIGTRLFHGMVLVELMLESAKNIPFGGSMDVQDKLDEAVSG